MTDEGDHFLDKVLCVMSGLERFDIAPHSNSLEVGLLPRRSGGNTRDYPKRASKYPLGAAAARDQ